MITKKEPINKIRRGSLTKDDIWIREFLTRGSVGTMATCIDEQPFLVTRNYAYDVEHHVVYLHGAKKGRTYKNLRNNDKVCFSVSEMGRLLPAHKACEVSMEFASVIIFGRCTIVNDNSEATHGLQLLLDKYFPHLTSGEDYEPITPDQVKTTAVLRIDIESWSGKEKKGKNIYPSAFYYGRFPFDPNKGKGESIQPPE